MWCILKLTWSCDNKTVCKKKFAPRVILKNSCSEKVNNFSRKYRWRRSLLVTLKARDLFFYKGFHHWRFLRNSAKHSKRLILWNINGCFWVVIYFRSSHPELFLGKAVPKICSKFTGEHPCRSKQLYWNHTSAWVFSCKLAVYFWNTFS